MRDVLLGAKRRAKQRKAFRKMVLAVLEEYIEEAEHMEGTEYWSEFTTESLLQDFGTYLFEKFTKLPTNKKKKKGQKK